MVTACATISVVTAPSQAASAAPPADAAVEPGIGESRWPPAAALLVFMALNIGLHVWLPSEQLARLPWLVPAVEAVLLALLLVGHPGGVAKHARWLRGIAVAFVV